jgi:type IX secretion system PorP/SprF family membrane protein
MKTHLLAILLLVSAKIGWAQQSEHYTQYGFNQFAFNPAVAGTKPCIDVRLGYRFQWVGIDDAPSVGFANVHAPIKFNRKKKRSQFGPKSGAGLQIKRDAFGPFSMIQAEVAYAAHVPISRYWTFSLGASIGMKQAVFNAGKLTTQFVDPLLAQGTQSFVMFPDGKIGFWIADHKTYFGLSVHHLFGNQFKNPGGNPLVGTAASHLQRHYYFTAGRIFPLEKKWSLIPSVFAMYTYRTPIDFHMTALFDLDNKLGFGIGLRRTDAITALVRVKLFDLLSIGYSFDFVISKLRGNMFYTHEITAGYNSCNTLGNNATVNCPVFE